jgi:hypothetical protein
MEAGSSFLTDNRVAPVVTTTVAGTYLASVPLQPKNSPRADAKVEPFRLQVSPECFRTASAVGRVLDQLGEPADRVVLARSAGIAFIFLGGAKYAMLESDEDGALVALLSDRASSVEAESWVVEPGGLTTAVRKVRSFLGSPHDANP